MSSEEDLAAMAKFLIDELALIKKIELANKQLDYFINAKEFIEAQKSGILVAELEEALEQLRRKDKPDYRYAGVSANSLKKPVTACVMY